ncbi:MAG TPA: phosphoribosylaminoimidazolesuccinocarboxamide synthase, partial [archaeon]|nr:phosphoribosylaminoimidazolesuccinocarboxamide synthase [archaeon]
FVRKWLADKGFKGDGPVPVIPAEVRVETAKRYIQAFELITGEEFTAVPGNPEQRIRESLAGKGYL